MVKFKKLHLHDFKYWVGIITKLQIILCSVIRLTHFLKIYYTGLNSAFLKLWEVRSWHPVLLFHGSRKGKWKQWNGGVVLVEVVLEGCSEEGPLEIWGHLGRSFVIWRHSYKWYLWKRQDHGGNEDQPKCKAVRMQWGDGRNGGTRPPGGRNGGSWHHNKEYDFLLKNIGCHFEKGLTQRDSVTMICSWEQGCLDQGEK